MACGESMGRLNIACKHLDAIRAPPFPAVTWHSAPSHRCNAGILDGDIVPKGLAGSHVVPV